MNVVYEPCIRKLREDKVLGCKGIAGDERGEVVELRRENSRYRRVGRWHMLIDVTIMRERERY